MIVHEMQELIFSGPVLPQALAAPQVETEFTWEDGAKKVLGFYDGAGIYKVRFLPEKAGNYHWKVTGVVQGQGEALCTYGPQLNESDLSTCSRGRSHGKVSVCGQHFTYADGGWYQPFGTTVYGLAHQNDALIEETLCSLEKAPYNKIRMCLFPKYYEYNREDPEYFPFEKSAGGGWDVGQPCLKFWQRLDRILDRLEVMDIQADLILFHPYDRWGFSKMSMEDNLLYLETVIRRLSARPNVWWSLANEYDVLPAFEKEDWYILEDFLADRDPFHHLLSNHNWVSFYDFTREHVTHVCVQYPWVQKAGLLAREYKKPVIYDEMGYEGNVPMGWGNLSGFELVNRFWCVCTQGAWATHGEAFESEDEVLWWSKGGALKGESTRRIAWLRAFMESLPGPLTAVIPPMAVSEAPMSASDSFMDAQAVKEMLAQIPESVRGFTRAMLSLSPVERERTLLADPLYAGHCGSDAYLYYYARTCPCRVDIELPEDGSYTVEVLDVWEMTRQTVMENTRGAIKVFLPSKEGMAVYAERTH